jgi:hypothetical protein
MSAIVSTVSVVSRGPVKVGRKLSSLALMRTELAIVQLIELQR